MFLDEVSELIAGGKVVGGGLGVARALVRKVLLVAVSPSNRLVVGAVPVTVPAGRLATLGPLNLAAIIADTGTRKVASS